jgi:hypothetical protein
MNRWLVLTTVATCLFVFSPVKGDPARDEVALKISRALTHHLSGEDATAADLLEEALATLRPLPLAPEPVGPDVPRGNAGQLLDYLDVYALYALGQQSDLDDVYDILRAELLRIDAIDSLWPRPSRWEGYDLDFDPFTHLVDEVGGLAIAYDPFRPQIVKIGRFEIDYDPFTHQPVDIGGIELDYDPFSHRPTAIAGVEIPQS